jgi:hypothetical protein
MRGVKAYVSDHDCESRAGRALTLRNRGSSLVVTGTRGATARNFATVSLEI